MYQRDECIAQASICREKAQADPAHHDYWIDEAIGWLQRAIPTGHKNAATRDVRNGRLDGKDVELRQSNRKLAAFEHEPE
jgi:hypothetical protein